MFKLTGVKILTNRRVSLKFSDITEVAYYLKYSPVKGTVREFENDICIHKEKTKITCSKCNTDCTNNYTIISGTVICSDCNEALDRCNICGEKMIRPHTHVSGVCESCVRLKYRQCHHCGELHLKRTMYCSGGFYFCDDCYDGYFVECYECGDMIYYSNAYRIDDDNYCRSCYNEYHDSDRVIKDYCYTPRYTHYGDKRDTMIGIELEVDTSDATEVAEEINDIHPMLFCKYDGSVRGFEIVSHPTTYKYLLDNNIIETISKITTKRKCKSHNGNTCGIHIHVSRENITTLQLFRILAFFRKYPDKILDISQRNMDRLNQWSRIDTNISNLYYKCKNKKDDTKYTAINLTHDDTIEFRIFRGNLRVDRIKKNIEFVLSLLEFCRDISINENTWDNYCDFLTRNVKSYKHILEYIVDKDLI